MLSSNERTRPSHPLCGYYVVVRAQTVFPFSVHLLFRFRVVSVLMASSSVCFTGNCPALKVQYMHSKTRLRKLARRPKGRCSAPRAVGFRTHGRVNGRLVMMLLDRLIIMTVLIEVVIIKEV